MNINSIICSIIPGSRIGPDRMGRHAFGSGFFPYVRDPWGSHATHDGSCLWGPAPPPGFIGDPQSRNPEKTVAA